jgi:hypothetical protein
LGWAARIAVAVFSGCATRPKSGKNLAVATGKNRVWCPKFGYERALCGFSAELRRFFCYNNGDILVGG